MEKPLTIGQLAKQVGLRTSALRYYEAQGLLTPAERTDSGYRLYDPKSADTLRFIQRAQRLGFSLADIRILLDSWLSGTLDEDRLLPVAQQRYLELERQMTQSLVLQHELGLFLEDLRENKKGSGTTLNKFLDRVCNNPLSAPNDDTFEWLLSQSGCILASPEGRRLLEPLRGQHVHVWQQEEQYHILVVSRDEAVGAALESLAALEAECRVHAHHHTAPLFADNDEGYLFITRGENAFIYVRLFLMLEKLEK